MTMRKVVFLFAVGVLASVWSAPSTLETVWLKDVTARFQTDKRTFGDLDLPNELTFHISRGSDTLTLNLKRNHDINPNADIYFVRKLEDGQSVLVKSRNLEKKDVAYYQDRENGAYMTVRCVKKLNEQCDRAIKGHIRIGDSSYDLRPAETDVTSRNVLEEPGLLGKRYVLQDHALIQRENSVASKDAAHINEKEVEQERKAVLRRFERQHKHNRGPTDASCQVEATYYVKIAVLIDSGLWDLYSSTVRTLTPLTKNRDVKRKIKELYSHIMNGVSLLYKGIEDTSISINIILSDFIFFKLPDDLPRVYSKVEIVNGTKVMNAYEYLGDVKHWDEFRGWRHQPRFDHAMLFTTYDLYRDFINDTRISGLTYTGKVCERGLRTSVIERGDYIWMVLSATHELGHNLGAKHDAERPNLACGAEDLFIMSPNQPIVGPNTTYSRNYWRFSKCSVEAFKDVLKDKDCVTHNGPFFNLEDYRKYVKKQPGEVYSVNEQCRLIYGAGSVCCETVPADYCHAMKCKDPKTGTCIKEYVRAASGTNCGKNMWCFEARCVPKSRN